MSSPQLKNSFDYLMSSMCVNLEQAQRISYIIKRITLCKHNKKSRFEYSLQIMDSKLQKAVRFVNYAPLVSSSEIDYLSRVNLIRDIVGFNKIHFPAADIFFSLLINLKKFMLPIFIGVEVVDDKIKYKLYVNFFNLYKTSPLETSRLVRFFIKEFNRHIELDSKRIILFGISLDDYNENQECKVYSLRNRLMRHDKIWFNSKALSVFNWLRNYNKFCYFDIMNRYGSKKIVSKKLEIHPVSSKAILSEILKRVVPLSTQKKISSLINKTSGMLEAVTFENNTTTLYFTMTNYGSGKNFKFQ